MFKKRETLLQNIAFMSLMAAMTIILAIIASFFPVAAIFVMIFLPFFSAVTALMCKWKYYPIYAIATLLLSLISISWNMGYTVFYILPSIITGFLFGLCFKYKLSGTYALLLTSIAQCALTCAFMPLINFIYDVDVVNQFLTVFNLTKKANIDVMFLSFIYLMSLIQMLFSYIVLYNELKKFDELEILKNNKLIVIVGLSLALLVVPLLFFALRFAYLFMFIAMFLMINMFVNEVFNLNKLLIIIYSITIAINIVLFISLYNQIKMPYTLLVLNTANILIFIVSFIYNLCGDKRKCLNS